MVNMELLEGFKICAADAASIVASGILHTTSLGIAELACDFFGSASFC